MNKIQKLLIIASISAVSTTTLVSIPIMQAWGATQSVTTSATDIDAIVKRVNEGSAVLADYRALGITNIKTEYLDIISREINVYKDAIGADLTVDDIKDAVSSCIVAIVNASKSINDGVASADDYTFLGIDNVSYDNLEFINNYLKERKFSTLTKVKDEVNKLNNAASVINAGSATGTEYNTLILTDSVNSINVDIINKEVNEAKESKRKQLEERKIVKSNDLSMEEIVKVTNDNLEKIQNTMANIDQGIGSKEDYHFIGAENVNDDNLSAVNDWEKEKHFTQISEIIDGANGVIICLNNINSGDFNEMDLDGIGIPGINPLHIPIVKDVIAEKKAAKGATLTKEDIINAIQEVQKLLTFYDTLAVGTTTVSDFESIGITGVNGDDIAELSELLSSQEWKTLPAIQSKINSLLNSLKNINAGTGSIDDYGNLKIQGVDSAKLSPINQDVQKLKAEKGRDLAISEVKESVKGTIEFLTAIANINSGNDSESDYSKIGINGVTADKLPIIRISIIAEKQAVGSDLTKDQIEKVVKEVQLLLDFYNGISSGSATIADYQKIGITEVAEVDVPSLNEMLKDKSCSTLKALQDRIKSILTAQKNINAGTETIDEYVILGVQGVDSSKLSTVKENIKKLKTEKGRDLTIAEIKESAKKTVDYINSSTKISRGEGTIIDFTIINIRGLTEINIRFINERIKTGGCISLPNIEIELQSIVQLSYVYVRVISGGGTVQDYISLGISNVTEANIIYVNAEIKDKQDINIIDIQNRINTTLVNITYINKISTGEATIEDYSRVGIYDVYEEILVYVNADLRIRNYKTIDEIIFRINSNIKAYESLMRINIGEAIFDDYTTLGIPDLTSDLQIYIDADLKNQGYKTIDEVVARVQAKMSTYNALMRINLGGATIDDYITLGLTQVTSENITYINADLIGKRYVTIEEIRIYIAQNISNYNLLIKINLGQATITDYRLIGITTVIDYNIYYVNIKIRIAGPTTIIQVKRVISTIVIGMKNQTVTGLVKDATTGAVIPGATIKFRAGENNTTGDYFSKNGTVITIATDAQGKYTISLPEGAYTAEVVKDGYVTKTFVVNSNSTSKNTLQNVLLERVKYNATGVVKDAITGNTIEGVAIKFRVGQNVSTGSYYSEGGKEIVVYTDAQGNYTVSLPQGTYTAEAIKDGYVTKTFAVNSNSTSKDTLQGVQLDRVKYAVTGVVKDAATGNVMQGVAIRFRVGQNVNTGSYYSEGGNEIVVYTDAQGKYNVNLIAGTYTAEAVKDGYVTKNFVVNSNSTSKDTSQNVQLEKVKYVVTGVVKDAATGSGLAGVAIRFRVGQDVKTGSYYSEGGNEIVVYTDSQGKYAVNLLPGTYTTEAKKDGYITVNKVVYSNPSNTTTSQDMVLSKALAANQYRVVLTWNESPRDLDSYFTGRTGSGQSIKLYYNEPKVMLGSNQATLDTDQTHGYGPETVTFIPDANGKYTYTVFDQTDDDQPSSNKLSLSGAIVKVYKGNQEIKTYVVPTNKAGISWNVFRIENGQIIDVNSITTTKP